MKKVLFVIKGSALNRGMNTGIENLAWGLAELGMTIHILAGGSEPKSHNFNIPQTVHYHFTNKKKTLPETYFDDYLRIVKNENIGAVVGWVRFVAPLSNLMYKDGSAPTYIVNQGHLKKDNTLSRVHNAIDVRKFIIYWILKYGYELNRPLHSLLSLRKYYSKIDLVISISLAVQNNVIKIYGFNPPKCSVIYRGVDTEKYAMKNINILEPYRKINLLYAGNILKVKGLEDIIDSTAYINCSCILTCCGTGEEEYILELKDRFNRISKASSIYFTGPLSQNDLVEQYHKCDIFVFPSLSEGLGKALLEAMSCGCPVVVTDIPAIREVIVDRENGLLVPAKSPRAIAEAIEEYLKNPHLARSCSQNARKTIQNQFSKESEAKEWFKILSYRNNQ